MLAVATCNYPAGVPDCNGGSSVFDGVVYMPELDHSRDTCLLQADEKEGVYLAELDLDSCAPTGSVRCMVTPIAAQSSRVR